jgi:SAM-dependent methyltransferase
MEDEFAVLTREMPEFRMPDESADSEAAPSAAIISGRRRPRSSSPASDDAAPETTSSPQNSAQDSPEPGHSDEPSNPENEKNAQESGYDRQAVVKTIQMRAVDRDELDRQFYEERLKQAAALGDHRFAPDVLISPPRLLTTHWQEGGPLQRAADGSMQAGDFDGEETQITEPGAWPELEGEAGDETSEPTDLTELTELSVKPQIAEDEAPVDVDDPDTIDDENLPELDVEPEPIEPESIEAEPIEPEPIEIDLEDLDEAEAKPPPKPAAPQSAAPRMPVAQDSPQKRPARQTIPPRPPEEAESQQDSEVDGLVQELLDDEKPGASDSEAGKAPDAQATANRQKRQSNRPRSPRDTWFQKVFSEEYLRTLPRDIHRQTRRDVDFIESNLKLGEGDRVLDLACGFGRHSIELTRRGHEVVGLDLSMPMLQKALNEAQRQSLSIKFLHGDMRELKFDGIFSACFLWQTSFGYFDEQTNFRVLRGIHRALRPGGEVLIDVLNRDHIVTQMPHRLWWEGVNCVFLEEVELDHRTSVLHTKRSFIYEDGTPPLEQNSFIRLYSAHELRQLLQAAGFAVVELSGELHHPGQFLGPASTRIVMRAQKRPPKGGHK